MLASLRRCPASLPRLTRLASNSSRHAFSASPVRIARPSIQSKIILPTVRSFTTSPRWQEEQEGPITEFKELEERGLVHPSVIESITQDMQLSNMTDVQTATINEALEGRDMFVRHGCSLASTYTDN